MKALKRILIVGFVFFSFLNKGVSAEDNGPVLKRLEGQNRIETAVAVSQEAFTKSKTAIIVGFNGEVDALTGTILAEKKKAPILMTHRNRLDKALIRELKRLDVEEVFIIGGEGIVRPEVEEGLKDLGLDVSRISGQSREETAINVAKKATRSDSGEAFVTLGYGVYADALAIGPIAASKNVPLLLTNKDKIKDETLDYLKASNTKTVTIVGGENAVSKDVERDLVSIGIKVKRIQGRSREGTAIKIAEEYIKNPEKIILANGYKYADAVVGGYLGAKENSPILLNNDRALNHKNATYIQDKGLSTTVLGGNSSIGASVFKNIKAGLGLVKDPVKDELVEEDLVEEDIIEDMVEDQVRPGGDSVRPSLDGMTSEPSSLKDHMVKELKAFKADISIAYEGSISSDEVRVIIRDIYSDGSYIGGAIKSITPRVKIVGNNSQVNLRVDYYNTPQEEAFIDSEVARIIGRIIKPGMSDFQKVKTVHDYIVNNTTYSQDTIKTSHSAYAALVEGKAVCQGYALLTYRLLDALGIENYYVIGDTLGRNGWGLHAWNLVKIDGRYYNMDTTKNDPLTTDGSNFLSYKYFLVSDKKFSETHRPNRDIFPRATDTRYEVFTNAYNPFEYNNSLYFGNINDSEKLYSISLDTLQLKKISDNRAPSLVVDGDRIYFSNFSNRGHIYSSDLNGGDLIQLNQVYSTNLSLQGSHIKFFNKSTDKWDTLNIR